MIWLCTGSDRLVRKSNNKTFNYFISVVIAVKNEEKSIQYLLDALYNQTLSKQNFEIMTKHGFWKLGVIGMSAISGIEHALWDILGKSLNTPVWQLLGGKVRDKIKIYTHLGMGNMEAVYRDTMNVSGLIDHATKLVDLGYKSFKVVFIPFTHYTSSKENLKYVNLLMSSLRDKVGDQIDIMVDFHGRCASGTSAIQYIKELEHIFHSEVLET